MGQTSQTVSGVDTTTAKQEPAEEPVVVDPARAILQGFAGDARVTVTNAMYSGSIESIVRSSSAMNVDSGMGGAAGKEDDKKKDSAYDHLVRQAAANWDDWKRNFDNADPYDQYRMAQAAYDDFKKTAIYDANGNHDWAAEAKRAGITLSDDVLKKRDGETDEQHRARMEQALKDELFDANGNLKDKYKGSVWAQDLAKGILAREKLRQAEMDSVYRSAVSRSGVEKYVAARDVIAQMTAKDLRAEEFRGVLNEIGKIKNITERTTALNEALKSYSDLGTADWTKNRVTPLTIDEAQAKLTEVQTDIAATQAQAGVVQQEVQKVQAELKIEADADDWLAEIDANTPVKTTSAMRSQFGAAHNGEVQERTAEDRQFAASTVPTAQQNLPKLENV